MAGYMFPDTQKVCCLTCHYFKCDRRIKIIGTKVFIEHQTTLGECSLVTDSRGKPFKRSFAEKPPEGQICRYKRWIDLP